jgi:hypothetical protein
MHGAEVRLVTYWSAIQACVWIATRDERLVARVRPKTSLAETFFAEEDENIAGRSLDDADRRITLESAAAGEEAPDVFGARRQILTAAAEGNIAVVGRLRGSGNAVEIPRLAWANLEIRDHSNYGVVAASPDLFDPLADWWDSLRIEQRVVQRQWPFPRTPEHRRVGYRSWDDRPDTVAENAWAMRRWRLASGFEPSIVLDDDGLPPDPEISLVEAWSWCAFGCAIPHTVWIDQRQLEEADREFAGARKSAAYFLREFRRARFELKKLGPRSESASAPSYTVKIVHGAAATSAHRALEEAKKAQDQLGRLIGNWKVIQRAYRNLHDRRSVPISDQNLVQRVGHEAEQALIRGFLTDELECLGRFGAKAGNWQRLPQDCFRWPVHIRINHNILEPTDNASVDQHRAIAEHVSVWKDLRVSKSKLKAWHLGYGPKGITADATGADALTEEQVLGWAKPIVERMANAGRQLRREQFASMLEERFASELPPKAVERLWLVAVPENWRKPSQGRLKTSARVANWREYENP